MTRTDIINNLIKLYGFKSYLELGTDSKALNFNKIVCNKKACVDINPKAGATYTMSTDAFFHKYKHTWDCIFVDADHAWESAFKDIQNSLQVLNKGGIIVVHDCNPTNEAMQIVPRKQGIWTGNVWRAFINFRTNPYLYTTTIDTDYGVGIIHDGRQEFVNIPYTATYQDFAVHKHEWLNLVPEKLDPVSIVIPAFEQYGHGGRTLTLLLNSMLGMKGKFEVVVSDNSYHTDDMVFKVTEEFKDKLPIRYLHNPDRGVSHNTNFAINAAQYDLIKPMYQDDLFLSDTAIENISFALKIHPWIACAGKSIDGLGKTRKNRLPVWNKDMIVTGENRLGMPSVIAFRKNGLRFDTNLKTMLDCAFYYELYQHYGDPGIIKVPLIGSRYWEGSTSAKQGSFVHAELPYLRQKYNL